MCGVRITLSKRDERRLEARVVALRLDREDVDRGAVQVPALERVGERVDVDHACRATH